MGCLNRKGDRNEAALWALGEGRVNLRGVGVVRSVLVRCQKNELVLQDDRFFRAWSSRS